MVLEVARRLRLVDQIAVDVDAKLALEAAYAAHSRDVPDCLELFAQRFWSMSNRDSLEAVLATVRAGVRAGDAFRAF